MQLDNIQLAGDPRESKDISRSKTSESNEYVSDTMTSEQVQTAPVYRPYKRRFVGLAILMVANTLIASNNVTFSIISTSAAAYFNTNINTINWIGIAGCFGFALMAPIVIWLINRYGVKVSTIVALALNVIGNWLRYAGTNLVNFPLAMVGSVLISFSLPFVLCSPTHFSHTWFSERGRTSATAVATLAAVIGEAIASLVTPYLAAAVGIPNLVLITAIIATILFIPTWFMPSKPPSPPSAVGAAPTLDIKDSLKTLPRIAAFYLQLLSFSVFAGALAATSSLVNQIIYVYGFTEYQAGVAACLLVFVGIAGPIIMSPILDRTKKHLFAIKCLAPVLAGCYIALIFLPQSGSAAGVYTIFSMIGFFSFALTPCTLEFQVTWTHPVPPEVSSTVCWVGANISQALYIIIMDQLETGKPLDGQPQGSLINGLVFQAATTVAVIPAVWVTGIWIFRRPAASNLEGVA